MTFKHFLLALVVLFVAERAPWRLMAAVPEVLSGTPGYARVASGNDDYWKVIDLTSRLSDLGWSVKYKPLLAHNVFGLTVPEDHTIFIEETLSWNGRYNVLTHEGAHTQQPGWLDERQAEMFAESVSLLMRTDPRLGHSLYLARYKVDFLMMVALEWPDIYRAAAALEN